MTHEDELNTPCYVVRCDGFRDHVSYVDDWCYGKSRFLGVLTGDASPRALIADDIRQAFDDRNGLPLYHVSDHGNVSRVRGVFLRKRSK